MRSSGALECVFCEREVGGGGSRRRAGCLLCAVNLNDQDQAYPWSSSHRVARNTRLPSPPLHPTPRPRQVTSSSLLVSLCDGDLDLHSRVDADLSEGAHDLRGRVEVDEALVDAQLEAVPRVGALTAGRLASRNAEGLSREAHRTGVTQTLGTGALDQILAHCTHTGGRGRW